MLLTRKRRLYVMLLYIKKGLSIWNRPISDPFL